MQHCEPDDLALLALGESPGRDATDHLAGCDVCRAEYESLRAVVVTARNAEFEQLIQPPPEVWQGIASELGLSGRDVPHATRPAVVSAPEQELELEPEREPEPAVVAPIASRRGRSRATIVWAAAAAVVGIVAGAVGATIVAERVPSSDVISSVALEPLEDPQAGGKAVLHTVDGHRALRVELTGLPGADDGFYEVWLMNAETGGSVSLGAAVPGERIDLPVPDDLLLDDFPYVDVSLEPLDGDPAHSSVSVVRGRLV